MNGTPPVRGRELEGKGGREFEGKGRVPVWLEYQSGWSTRVVGVPGWLEYQGGLSTRVV